VLLLAGVAVAACLTWIIPAGTYERRTDPGSGRPVVIAGTYKPTARAPVGPVATIVAVPRGIVSGGEVVLTILFVGGAFALLDATGALARLVGALAGGARHPRLIIVVVSLLFATLGALEDIHEEIIALVPVLLTLSGTLGFGAVTSVAISIGAAVVGAAFGPTNPFLTAIALRFAELPPLSRPGLRFVLLVIAVAVWIVWTLAMIPRDDLRATASTRESAPPSARDVLLFALCILPFIPYVIGVIQWDWGFNELSATFLVVGFIVGVVSGRSLSESAAAFLESMKAMLPAALFVGVARGISVVLTDGRVLDTIVYGLATPLAHAPGTAAALLMIPAHALLHVPLPSVSGQAVLTMPIMAPLADLLGVSRDSAVIAYQTGAGLMDMITPTDGALLAILLGAGVPYGRWLRFAVPGALLVGVVGVVGVVLAT
jgi:uncharacterized ion transporter superfamily protein YfcC